MCTALSKIWGSPCFQQIHNIVSFVTPTKKKTNEHYNILIVKYHYDHLKNNRIIQTVSTSNEFTNVSDHTSFKAQLKIYIIASNRQNFHRLNQMLLDE